MITDTIDKQKDNLTSNELRDMSQNSMDIESHTLMHLDLRLLFYEQQLNTLAASKNTIESLIEKKVYCIAYPSGKYNRESIKATQDSGYKIAFTTHYGFANKTNGLLTLNRIRIDSTDTLDIFSNKIIFN